MVIKQPSRKTIGDLKEIVMDKRREEVLQKWILNKQNTLMYASTKTGRSVTSSIRVGSRMTDITFALTLYAEKE